ncbi:MAG: hypothetical protein MMC23_004633 [Stictis urceolatum]|nr:hypothetical protein [Stictis urceolata]
MFPAMLKRLSYAICFFSPAAVAAASQQQYCRVNPVKEIDFCFTLASFQNVSTNAHDVYIRASSRFSNRMGWVAFGTGEIMDSAMMFVFYPGEADDDIVVSLRTTFAHAPPTLAGSGPDYRILEVSHREDYFDIALICYDCQNWDGNSLDVQSTKQSFIFSSQPHQRMQSADPSKALQLHADYASFTIDMQAAQFAGPPEPPSLLDNGRKTVGIDLSDSEGPKWRTIHGLLMVLAFTLLMPGGVACLRSGVSVAFAAHWMIQLAGTLVALSAAVLAVMSSRINLLKLERSALGAHSSLGAMIVVSLLAQPIFGYIHHIRFRKYGRTWVSSFHSWLGRVLLASAWINTMLGLYGGGVRTFYIGVWLVMMVAAVWTMEGLSQGGDFRDMTRSYRLEMAVEALISDFENDFEDR